MNIDLHQPYPFNAWVDTQGTTISAAGTMARAFDVRSVSGRLRVSGPDLADLYHVTGVALPNTPPYDLATFFARAGSHYALRQMVGRVGESDLEGEIAVDDTSGRPLLTADLSSRRLNLADLSAVAGGVPKHAPARALSPIQRETAAKLTAEHRIFPDTHLDVSRIRSTDADVTYRARSVAAGRFSCSRACSEGGAPRWSAEHRSSDDDPAAGKSRGCRALGRQGVGPGRKDRCTPHQRPVGKTCWGKAARTRRWREACTRAAS